MKDNMQSIKKISIILVTYNINNSLQKCLDSIYSQSHSEIEIIVIDGGSTDGTVEILKSNSDKIHYWKSETDNGIYEAMNKALNYITGEWVYFLGADDVLLPEFSSMVGALKDPDTIYYGSVLKEGQKYLGVLNAYQQAKTGICHQAIIYPVSVFKVYKFDTNYPISADHLLNMWCWKDKRYKFKFIDFIIAKYNHTGISSIQKDLAFENKKSSFIYKYYGLGIWLRFTFKKIKQKLLRRPV
ncbi:glycosyltransferase family 2 protein [Rubrolithibacter danxiaensis]|uniref:glycosyltransferase family 2 protein n=1 Tax=Rubrolithibacter danxiaensis TaxID=3390805 RepID=UPI003BF77A88